MKKFLTYDLETTFLQKGQKRPSQRILEIALFNGKESFSALVNPCDKYSTGHEVIQSLEDMNQHPEASLRFWTKLLVEKRALPSHLKRGSVDRQASAISSLLIRSDLAREKAGEEYTESQWLYALENHNDSWKTAQQYLNKYDVKEKPKSLMFTSTLHALKDALDFGNNSTWIAHNGKSFDMPIVKGNCDRNNLIYSDIQFEDSLPMFKRNLTSDSYSQPVLYRNCFSDGYKAHHALDDAKALYKLIRHVAKDRGVEELFKVKKLEKRIKLKSDLLEIKGVGQKTLFKLKAKGIHNRKQLNAWTDKHTQDEFLEEFRGLYKYKDLAHKLYNTATV